MVAFLDTFSVLSLLLTVYTRLISSPWTPWSKAHTFIFREQQRWARIDEQVMCGSVYLYILDIRRYVPNTFLALPNFWKRWILVRILANTICESQFLQLLVNLCENVTDIRYSHILKPFSENRRMCDSILRLVCNYVWPSCDLHVWPVCKITHDPCNSSDPFVSYPVTHVWRFFDSCVTYVRLICDQRNLFHDSYMTYL